MSKHIYNPEFNNQYFTLKELSKITKISITWLNTYINRAEFNKFRTSNPGSGGGILIRYNEELVNLINQFRNRKWAKGCGVDVHQPRERNIKLILL